MMAYAFFVQYVEHLSPCNMCMLQRFGVVAVGAAFLLAALHNPGRAGAVVYALLIAVTAGATAATSGRQVWMQAQPLGSLPSCGADFWTMLDMFPVTEVVTRILKGGAECQVITWSLFGLSMAAWVMLAVAAIGAAGIVANLSLERQR
jgi:disulfide bond formation protein DsbB